MQNSPKLKPTVIEYLLRVTLEDNPNDRVQSVAGIVEVLNRKIVHKGKKTEIAKMFLAALLVIIAVVSVRKSGIIDIIKRTTPNVVTEQTIEIVEEEFKFVTKRTSFEFGMSHNIRWLDPHKSGMYHVSLMTNECVYAIFTEEHFLDLEGFGLNPGQYSMQVENANMEVISMDFEVIKPKGMTSIIKPSVTTPQYAFYTFNEQVISWESDTMSQVLIYDLDSRVIVTKVTTEQRKLNLKAFDLPKGKYLINIQSSEGKVASDFNHIHVELFNEGDIITPIIKEKEEISIQDYIQWEPMEKGEINIKFIHSSGRRYEKFSSAAEGQMMLEQNMLLGEYMMYITYTVDDASSEVVEKQILIVD